MIPADSYTVDDSAFLLEIIDCEARWSRSRTEFSVAQGASCQLQRNPQQHAKAIRSRGAAVPGRVSKREMLSSSKKPSLNA